MFPCFHKAVILITDHDDSEYSRGCGVVFRVLEAADLGRENVGFQRWVDVTPAIGLLVLGLECAKLYDLESSLCRFDVNKCKYLFIFFREVFSLACTYTYIYIQYIIPKRYSMYNYVHVLPCLTLEGTLFQS